jgi:hypothetical protein
MLPASVNSVGSLVVDRIANDRAGHAMPATAAAPQLGARNCDDLDTFLAHQCVRIGVAVIGPRVKGRCWSVHDRHSHSEPSGRQRKSFLKSAKAGSIRTSKATIPKTLMAGYIALALRSIFTGSRDEASVSAARPDQSEPAPCEGLGCTCTAEMIPPVAPEFAQDCRKYRETRRFGGQR